MTSLHPLAEYLLTNSFPIPDEAPVMTITDPADA